MNTRIAVWGGALILAAGLGGVWNLYQGAKAGAAPAPPGSAIGVGTRERPAIVGDINYVSQVTLTRETGDTTQYAAGDEISNDTTTPSALEFTDAARINGGSGTIRWIQVTDSVNAATDSDPDLFLYDTTYTPINDNAAFAATDAESNSCIFAGDMGTAVASTLNLVFRKDAVNIPFKCATNSKSLFVRLVERSTYTPASAEAFVVRLGICQD